MDPNTTPENVDLSSSLHFNNNLRLQVDEAARWAKFLSIIGFVFCGLMIVLAFFINKFMGRMPGQENNPLYNNTAMYGNSMRSLRMIMPVIYILLAVLYFFPCLNLFRFATKAQSAIKSNSQEDITVSFTQLKSFFRFIGVLTIIALCVYGLALLVIVGVAMMK